MQRHSVSISRDPFEGDNFDSGYLELIAINRDFGGEVYDLVKQIPSFLRLIASTKSEQLFCHLRNTDAPGIGAASYGIRIDNPFEDKFRSHWHQEFISQPITVRSISQQNQLVAAGRIFFFQYGICNQLIQRDFFENIGFYEV